jgi:hypothetical protein
MCSWVKKLTRFGGDGHQMRFTPQNRPMRFNSQELIVPSIKKPSGMRRRKGSTGYLHGY